MTNDALEMLEKLQSTLEELKSLKPEDRSEFARRIQICVTEYEKVVAYFAHYVVGE